MSTRLKWSAALLYVAAAGAIGFGIVYLATPTIMPYHERFLGLSHASLDPRVAKLMLTFMRIMGACYLAIGVGAIWLVRRYLRDRVGIQWPVAAMALIALLPTLFATIRIGWFTPWWPVALMIVLVITALALASRTSAAARSDHRAAQRS